MRILSKNWLFILLAFVFLGNQKTTAQTGEVNIDQDDKIMKLIELKSDLELDRYRIQIFSGEIDGMQKTKVKFRVNFGDKWSNAMVYEEPNYKVWIGKFKSRLAADKALIEIREKFPNAFVFKPQIKTKKKKRG